MHMRKFVLAAIFCCTATPVLSSIDIPTCRVHPAALELRDIVYSNDIERVEATVSEAQRKFEAGQADALDVRCLFRLFTLMRPETAELVEDWLKRYPDSPFAQVAQAQMLNTFSWNIRGIGKASETYPQALAEFRTMQRRAWELASAAYAANPRFLPASDALIRMANANGMRKMTREIVNMVMATDANGGTVKAYQSQIVRNWGATRQDVEWICETWAQKTPGARSDSRELCYVRGALAFPETYDWAHAQLATNRYPSLDILRLQQLTHPNASRADALRAAEILPTFDHAPVEANSFDRLAMIYDLPPLTERLSTRGYELAKRRLEHQPLNPDLIRLLQIGTKYTVPNLELDLVEYHTRQVATPEEMLGYAQRRLIASPYNPDLWALYQTALNGVRKLEYAEEEPFRINQVVYSNHSPQSLQSYLSQKMHKYSSITKAKQNDPALFPEVIERLLRIDRDVEIVCPFVRAQRLFTAVCDGNADKACRVDPNKEKIFEFILEDAANRGICSTERNAPLESLLFTPMPVPTIAKAN